MFCYKCGVENEDINNFCKSCGSKLNVDYKQEQSNEEVKKGDFYYKEPILTSIIIGVTFIPNFVSRIVGILGVQYRNYAYIMTWIICILVAPAWISISIIVILFRIFVIPKLKSMNVL